MAWVDNSNGYKQVILRSSADGGKTFSESLSLSNDNVNTPNVNIYSNEKYVFIVRQQPSSPHYLIALQGSDDLGKSQVSVFDKYRYVTWVQRDAVTKSGNLYYKQLRRW